ncbi:nuclear transport factor 2 family protein [Streptomyces sp. NA04227]|uniref:nuclear transport factor 2 family protein n=1 Tax=Streptomyces sp. NA04227 TaxID=2742136 RepID=UPI00159038F5|nr:nuclear transport factor 2 family protein [Streptomyces sp. NA04227]QKW06675.1 nuclear transport factor 2 family protein [Streptomyces sp. NA04227]
MTTQTHQTYDTAHHVELTTLVSRYFRSLDETAADGGWAAERFFTRDASTRTPIGDVEGAAAIAEHTRTALGRFAATQHVSSDVLTEVDADSGRAEVSWNALMTHVHHESTLERRGPGATALFTVGGHVRAEAQLTEAGWRFTRMSIRAVWRTGEPPFLPEEVLAQLPDAPGELSK